MIFFLLAVNSFATSIGLTEAVDLALKNNKELLSQQMQVRQASTEVKRVHAEFGPRLEALGGVGPITKASGNATNAVEEKGTLGRMIMGRFTLSLPIYAWGRKTNYKNAAQAGIYVEEGEFATKREEVVYQTKEAFYGYQLANTLLDFVESGRKDLDKSLENRKKNVETAEAFKVDIFLEEIRAREAEVRKYFLLAQEGLALRVGLPSLKIKESDAWLSPKIRKLDSLDLYLSHAGTQRGELRQITEGIFAKRSLSKAEKKGILPTLAVFGSYELSDTNVRPAQPGVFSYDPYNRETWTLGIGFKMDLQWDLQLVKAQKHSYEAMELELKEQYAKDGIALEVKRAYWEVEEAETRLQAAQKAQAVGKKWLAKVAIQSGAGLGTKTQALIDAYMAKAETSKNYYESVHRYNLAWAKLSQVVGVEVDPLFKKK